MKSQYNLSPTDQQNKSKYAHTKQSESQKLQCLWDRLQDLSEVQDESRNQQMPIFLDDQSILSKHSETDSFWNTVQILDQPPHIFKSTIPQLSIQTQINKRVEKQQVKINQDISCRKIGAYCLNQEQTESLYHNNDKMKAIQNRLNSLSFCKQLIQKNNLNLKLQENGGMQNGGKSQENVYEKRVRQLRDKNEKLVWDNKKLFDECIKLRKVVLNFQNQQQKIVNKSVGKNDELKKQENKELIREQWQKVQNVYKQSLGLKQRLQELQEQKRMLEQKVFKLQNLVQQQLKQWKRSYKQRQEGFRQRQEELRQRQEELRQRQEELKQQLLTEMSQQMRQRVQKEMRQQLQEQIEGRYLNKIKELQQKINLKQKQLIDKSQTEKQLKVKYQNIQNQLQQQTTITDSLLTQIKLLQPKTTQIYQPQSSNSSQSHQLNTQIQKSNQQPLLSQLQSKNQQPPPLTQYKLSKTTSLKTTTINCRSALDKTLQNNLETLLKDKQRQINNIKIIHQSEIKKHKQTIKILLNQLQSINK